MLASTGKLLVSLLRPRLSTVPISDHCPLALAGMLQDLSPEELDTELANFLKTGKSEKLTLEQVIELQRAKRRAEGTMGTPVTEETLAAWKAAKAAKAAAAAREKVKRPL